MDLIIFIFLSYILTCLGFIFLIMPISFAVFLETDYELQKMVKATEGIIKNH